MKIFFLSIGLFTTLSYAMQNQVIDLRGAQINPINLKYTPLMLAAERGDSKSVKQLANSTNVNAVGPRGKTALHIASFEGNQECVSILIANGASLDVQDYNGETPCEIAIRMRYNAIARLLLANGANVSPVFRNELERRNKSQI